MKEFWFKTTGILLLMCVFFPVYAQSGSIKLKLEETNVSIPIPYATVSLSLPSSDSSSVPVPIKYVLSDAQGFAEIKDLKHGPYILKVEMMGYNTLEKNVLVAGTAINIGVLKMSVDVEVLEAATVSEVGNPVIVKKDTVEFATSSYKITENDMLEDLLKKLPGVEVDSDGVIVANGDTISKITINGKTFFLDDPKMATQNINAKIIEKIKVVEKKSDQAIFSGIDDGVRETIIDLSVHKGMLDGWSGNIIAGGGHDVPNAGDNDSQWANNSWRYRGAVTIKRFTDLSQLSIILNGNNTNSGTTTAWTAGLNGAYTLFDGDMDLSGNYKYNGSHRCLEEDSRKITYLDDVSNIVYENTGTTISNSQNHSFGVRLEHKFSDNTSILFEPKVRFGNGDSNAHSNYVTYSDAGDEVDVELNDGFKDIISWNKNWTVNGFLLFRQKLDKPGRTLSVNVSYNFNGTTQDGYNQSLTETFAEDVNVGDIEEEIVNQRYTSITDSYSISPRLVYTEPVAQDLFLEVNYSYSWNKRTSVKDTYNSSENFVSGSGDDQHLVYNPTGEIKDDAYSSSIVNVDNEHSVGANIMYSKEKLRAQLGASFRPATTDNETNGEKYHSTIMNWAPQAMFSYDFGDRSYLRIYYSGAYSRPPTSQLMPVANNADPLNVSFGNPYLEPFFTHSFRGTFAFTDRATFTSVQARMGGNILQDRITNATWYDSNGTQFSMPVNGSTIGNVDMRIQVTSPLASSNFTISNATYFRYGNSMTYVGRIEDNKGDELINRYYNYNDGTFDYEQFHKDFFESGSSEDFHEYFADSKMETFTFTERFVATFRNDLVEVNLGERANMLKSWNSITSNSQSANWTNQIDASMNWTLPEGFGVVAEGNYKWYNGYATPLSDEVIVNAEITKLFLESKFTLGLKVYDLFNQSKTLNVANWSNYHLETRSNVLGRYVILSLTFRFGDNNQR